MLGGGRAWAHLAPLTCQPVIAGPEIKKTLIISPFPGSLCSGTLAT